MSTIFPPEGRYTRSDLRMIELLARHLAEIPDGTTPTNRDHMTHLGEDETDSLLEFIETKLEEREFYDASSFVSAVAKKDYGTIRELYLSGRTRKGKTRAMSSKQYAEFLARIGLPSAPAKWYAAADRMEFDHFLRMERRAFQSLGISPKVIDLAIKYINLNAADLERARDSKIFLDSNFLAVAFKQVASSLQEIKKFPDKLADGQQLAGALTVVVNIGVLYTTRDWSVTGTLSTLAGGLGMTVRSGRN